MSMIHDVWALSLLPPASCFLLQVDLYAEFEPARLLQFLMLSPSYPLDHAYKVGMSHR